MVLQTTLAGRELITTACDQAQQAGITVGMSLAHARALVGREPLRVESADASRDQAALLALAHWSTRYLPRVAPDHDHDSLLADVTGCQRLYRGERRLTRQLTRAFDSLNLQTRIAIAPTFGCAWALAHYGHTHHPLIAPPDVGAALAALPVAALRIDDDDIHGLAQVGVETIGELQALPRATLPSRFTGELLWRLDQARGRAMETIEPVRPQPTFRAQRTFAGPVLQLEAIQITAAHLIDDLCDQLERAQSGSQRFRLTLERYRADPVVVDIPAARPCRAPRHLRRLVEPRVEKANLGNGVEVMTLAALAVSRIAHQQLGPHAPNADAAHAFGQLLDMLQARLGPKRISQIHTTPTHIPERVYRRRTPQPDVPPAPPQITEHARPSHLIHPPRPVRVIAVTPDGPVLSVHLSDRVLSITACHGPERICGQWWRTDRFVRDYFRVQDDTGQWRWLFRDHRGQWFCHGQWM